MAKKKHESSIAPAQLRKMIARYIATIDEHFRIVGPDAGDLELERARDAASAADELVRAGEVTDARHLVGLVQGILLCKKIRTWEYLASDDARE